MLMICTPCYGGLVSALYLQSIVRMMAVMHHEGVKVEVVTHAGESLITRARNTLANDFLRRTDCTHLLFIDADLGFPPDAPLRFLRSGKDVVCGVYPVKHLDIHKLRRLPGSLADEAAEAAAVNYAVKLSAASTVDADGFMEVDYAATGFMMIHRRVFEKIAHAHPELAYDYSYTNDDNENNVAFFDTFIDPETREYLPEDYAFCRRHAALGGVIHADIFSTFSHAGSYDYTGSFAAFLNNLGQGGQ
jgi:hypothetical protein